jgi:hypothetical protein
MIAYGKIKITAKKNGAYRFVKLCGAIYNGQLTVGNAQFP